ncbi:unnamed protein product [Gongylonema pulchrum]|uniref:Uncharacterized protein n=1 Tax=Gongylonema pulchrum TaxID=637853 RepID=A0A3P7ND87_9BILA|nr:unnamed protein product [Gongylonema pulchrum]
MVFSTQLAAAYLSYFFARSFWKMGLHRKHNELLNADHCEADLTATGSLIEGFATFGGKAVEFFTTEWYTDPRFRTLINCIFAGFITAIGEFLFT